MSHLHPNVPLSQCPPSRHTDNFGWCAPGGKTGGRSARGLQPPPDARLLGGRGLLMGPVIRARVASLPTAPIRSRSRGRCSSSRRRCPTSAARSLARRPRPSLGSSRRRTRGARRATRRRWWARRWAVMVTMLLSSPWRLLLPCQACWRVVTSRLARQRAAVAAARAVEASGR